MKSDPKKIIFHDGKFVPELEIEYENAEKFLQMPELSDEALMSIILTYFSNKMKSKRKKVLKFFAQISKTVIEFTMH